MGQQQLLLVILVTIIVGIATVVAINTFGTAADQANVDAVRQDMLQIAASAQQFYMRPTMLGGGGRSFAGISFNDFAFAGDLETDPEDDDAVPLKATNENGMYEITSSSDDSFVLVGHPASRVEGALGFNSDAEGGALTMTVSQDDAEWN